MAKKKRPGGLAAQLDLEAPMTSKERMLFRSKLLDLIPTLEPLGATDVQEAARALIKTLESTGPLQRKKIVPLMAVLDERIMALFERGVEETTGELQESLRSGAKAAREDHAWEEEYVKGTSKDLD